LNFPKKTSSTSKLRNQKSNNNPISSVQSNMPNQETRARRRRSKAVNATLSTMTEQHTTDAVAIKAAASPKSTQRGERNVQVLSQNCSDNLAEQPANDGFMEVPSISTPDSIATLAPNAEGMNMLHSLAQRVQKD
jgi:hypothetical protein